MGGTFSNGLILQIQRRADQEAFLKAFWEFREAVLYQFDHQEFDSMKHKNNFQDNCPNFTKCECSCPERFYPEEEILSLLDPQCLMRDREINTLWGNLHQSLDTVWKMLNKFDNERNENLSAFRVQYLKYNEHGAVDLISWRQKENKLFIIYMIVYLTFYPDAEGQLGILEAFETSESFKEYLEELKMAQFVKLSPLLRIFLKVHDFGDKENYFDAENDLENMVDYFFKRSYFQQISETRFNVYTAAIVYGNSMQLSNFGEKRRREIEQLGKRREIRGGGKKKNNKGMKSKIRNRHANKVAQSIEKVQVQAHKVGDAAQKVGDAVYGMEQELAEDFKAEQQQRPSDVETPVASASHSIAPRTFREHHGKHGLKIGNRYMDATGCIGKLFDHLSRRMETTDRHTSDYRSSIDKSISCLITQAAMYFCFLMLNPATASWEDGSAETPVQIRHFINVMIIFFTFQYVVTMSTNEFYIHTTSVLIETKSKMAKFLIFVNYFINTVMASTLIFSTAVVLKRSAMNVVDIVLNSTAIYFIADLDDMMISSTDEEILDDRVLFTYIFQLIRLSGKTDKGEICQYLKEERWWLIFQTYFCVLLLGYSYYAYFEDENFPNLLTYS
mmetsp:Transcript_17784/g.23459  ORF Transcript_17784/g.23459 Transcript_17784/m.23459 type:complete len:616 (+) Transcript_17784:1258-3105(+)